MRISALDLNVGSGSVDLTLPTGPFESRVDGGSGSLDIVLPAGVGVRVALDSGSGSFHPGDRLRLVSGEPDDDSVWETTDFDKADDRVEFSIDQGSGAIHFR